jgi:hypothetical protein
MATAAPKQRPTSNRQERTRLAWNAYRDGLRDLSGAEYERAEGAAWAHLQEELALLDDADATQEFQLETSD